MIKPISPDDIAAQKANDLPDAVIGCWNSMIARKYSGGTARILLSEASRELQLTVNKTHNEIRELGYLDIEDLYRAQGWRVNYDQPGYNESYPAYYEFSKRR